VLEVPKIIMSSKPTDGVISWRDLPTFVAIVGAISIALAISRQVGFFSFIDRKLLALFSVEDILSNSLGFVAFFVSCWVVGAILGEVAPDRIPRFIWRLLFESESPGREIKTILLFSIASIIFFDDWPVYLLFQSLFSFGVVISWLAQRGKLQSSISRDVAFGLLLLVQAFLLGASEASTALKHSEREYELTLKAGPVVEAHLLRATSEYLLVLGRPSELLVIPRTEVRLMRRVSMSRIRSLISVEPFWGWVTDKFARSNKSDDPAPPTP
jgi:hypothetical protein